MVPVDPDHILCVVPLRNKGEEGRWKASEMYLVQCQQTRELISARKTTHERDWFDSAQALLGLALFPPVPLDLGVAVSTWEGAFKPVFCEPSALSTTPFGFSPAAAANI